MRVLCHNGSDSKKLLPPKTVSWKHLFRPIATEDISWDVHFAHRNKLLHDPLELLHLQNASWELVSTICNELCQPLDLLLALPAFDCPPQWKEWNFLKNQGGSNLIVFYFLNFYFGYSDGTNLGYQKKRQSGYKPKAETAKHTWIKLSM